MEKIRLTLSNIVFWFSIIISCYFIENTGLLSEQPFRGFDPLSFFLLFGISILLIGTYLFLEHKYNKLKIDYVLLTIMAGLFALFTWTIWSQPDTTITNVETGFVARVTFSNFEKVQYTLELGISLLVMYLLIFVYSCQKVRNRKAIWIPTAFIVVNLLSCIGTIFTDLDTYKSILLNGNLDRGVSFWYYNENLFGFSLLLGILSCFTVNANKKKWWSFVLIFVFFAEMIFTTCVTTIFICIIAIPIYFIFEMACGIKKHPVLNIIFLLLFLSLIIGGIVSIAMLEGHGISFIDKLMNTVRSILEVKDFSTLSRRTIVWQEAIDFVSDTKRHLWFGRGYRTSTEMLRAYTAAIGNGSYISSAHSAYVEIIFRHGLIGIILYGLGLLYYLFSVFHLIIKKRARFALLHLLAAICIGVHGIMETDTFFTSNVTGVGATILFIMPVVRASKHLLHPYTTKDIGQLQIENNRIDCNQLSHLISAILMGLLVGVGSIMITPNIYDLENALLLIGFITLALVVTIFFLPYLISMQYRNSSQKRFVFRLVYSIALLLLIPFGIYSLNLFKGGSLSIGLILSLVGYCLVYIVLYMFYLPLIGSFKEWIQDAFYGSFVTPIFALSISTASGIIINTILTTLLPINTHSMIILSLLNIVIYFYTLFIFKTYEIKNLINGFNNNGLYSLKRYIETDLV